MKKAHLPLEFLWRDRLQCKYGSSGLDSHFRAWSWKNAKQQDRRSQKLWKAKQEHRNTESRWSSSCIISSRLLTPILLMCERKRQCIPILFKPLNEFSLHFFAEQFTLQILAWRPLSHLKWHYLREISLTILVQQDPSLSPSISTTCSMLSSL